VKDEPISSLLGGIVDGLTQKVLNDYYDGNNKQIPVEDYLGGAPPQFPQFIKGCTRSDEGLRSVLKLANDIPSTDDWLEFIAGPQPSWLRALLTSRTIVQGNSFIDNPMRRIFAPRPLQEVVIVRSESGPSEVKIFGSPRSKERQVKQFLCVTAVFDTATERISVRLYEDNRGKSLPLEFTFTYSPSQGSMPIHEVVEGRNRRIKEFYWKLWFPSRDYTPPTLRNRFIGPEIVISADTVSRFCASVGNSAEAFQINRSEAPMAPMDFAIVTGWEVSFIRSTIALAYNVNKIYDVGHYSGHLPRSH
jgi:fatty acid synthase subunit beta